MIFQPDLMQFHDGAPVDSAQDWPRRRQELLATLADEVYGPIPAAPLALRSEVKVSPDFCCAGHASLEFITLTAETGKGDFTFPFHLFLPKGEGPHPVFVLLNFRPDIYDKYYPAEELIDNGFALAVLNYATITQDNADMTDGLAGLLGEGCGKISLWAWGASRVLDYLLTRPEIDGAHAAVIGHSRLGKTALWCGANDPRFQYVFSNDSGCGGAALEKTKHEGGETIADIMRQFGYWFLPGYSQYIGHAEKMSFDQHYLLAAIAPRFVEIGSASLDRWADPLSEQWNCVASSPAWELLGAPGFIGPEEPAQVGDHFCEGRIGYHLRDGLHFLSRQDWLRYMAFMQKHL